MPMSDTARQMEAKDLAHAREVVQEILRGWDLLPWNVLLSDDVVLSVRFGAADFCEIGDGATANGNFRVFGREDVKRVLDSIYPKLKRDLSVTTEIVSGYEVVLLGNLVVPSTKENTDALSVPLVLYVAFDGEEQINRMTIAALDLQRLTMAIRMAVEDGDQTVPIAESGPGSQGSHKTLS